MHLTIVLPTFNESENLPKIVSALFSIPMQGLKIIVVDDNSPDGTGKIADKLRVDFPDQLSVIHRDRKLGLGTAYIQGFQAAIIRGAEAIGQMDADFSHPPEKLMEMMAALDCCDVVIGSRYIVGGNVDVNWPTWRKSLSAFGNFYARTILGLPIRDVTGGFRIWRRETLEDIQLERIRSNGYAFQVELAYVAYRLGFRFLEIPIYFADRKWGESKMSFQIQREAAIRVWQILFENRDIKRK